MPLLAQSLINQPVGLFIEPCERKISSASAALQSAQPTQGSQARPRPFLGFLGSTCLPKRVRFHRTTLFAPRQARCCRPSPCFACRKYRQSNLRRPEMR